MATLPAIMSQSVEKLMGAQISVTSPETDVKAREYLVTLRKSVKEFTATCKELKKPFKREIDEIDRLSKPLLEKLQLRDDEVERAILAYARKVKEETERRNQRELEKYEKKVEKAEQRAIENGKAMPLILPPALQSAPAKTVEVSGAKQTTVNRKSWRINLNGRVMPDPSALTAREAEVLEIPIPREFFKLDTAAIGKIVRAGGIIPGVEVYEEESLSLRES